MPKDDWSRGVDRFESDGAYRPRLVDVKQGSQPGQVVCRFARQIPDISQIACGTKLRLNQVVPSNPRRLRFRCEVEERQAEAPSASMFE